MLSGVYAGVMFFDPCFVSFFVPLFPQIAGSYKGSYFSKIGLLIPKIPPAATSVSFHLSPFMISILACSWLLLPSFVSLRDLHSGLLLAAPAFIYLPSWSPFWPALGCATWVSFHLSPCMISILACSWLPLPLFAPLNLSPFAISILACMLLAPAFICLPSFVSLRHLHSGLLLAAPAFICLPSWSPFRPALGRSCCPPSWSPYWPALGCACLHLSPFICPPSWSPFWPALGCSCLHMSPFICPPTWSPFWPALGCPCLHLPPLICLPLWSPFWPACSWLLLPPCLPSFVSLRHLHSGLLLAAPAFICPPSWSPFGPALGRSCLHLSPFVISILACSWLRLPSFVSLHLSPYMISILACSWLLLPSFVSLHLSPHMISILACSWSSLPPCLPSFLFLHLFPFMISIVACFWLPLFICLPSFVSLYDLHSGLFLAAATALSLFICLAAYAVGCGCLLVSLHSLSFVFQCWFLRLPLIAFQCYLRSMPVSFFFTIFLFWSAAQFVHKVDVPQNCFEIFSTNKNISVYSIILRFKPYINLRPMCLSPLRIFNKLGCPLVRCGLRSFQTFDLFRKWDLWPRPNHASNLESFGMVLSLWAAIVKQRNHGMRFWSFGKFYQILHIC